MVISLFFKDINRSASLDLFRHKLMSYPKLLTGLCVLIGVILTYNNPQGFIGLWLTPDQQGIIYFKQGSYAKASNTFINRQWRAYSQYANQEFNQAAKTWERGDQVEDLLFQANALAHYTDYNSASLIYKKIISIEPDNEAARKNLNVVEPLIKTMASEGESQDSVVGERKESKQKQDKKEEPKPKLDDTLTDELWLEQVNFNPKIFLKKKFFTENYEDVKRKAIEAAKAK